jgi:hypothetical protein
MFSGYDKFIDNVKELPTIYDRISFVWSYIVKNVQFNYAEAIKAALFSDIDSLYELSMSEDNTLPNYKELMLAKLYTVLSDICDFVFTDETIKNNTIDRIMLGVSLTNEKDNLLKMLGAASTYICGADYVKGLLQFGVCDDITDFAAKCFDDVGVPYLRVVGESHGLHEWLMVYVNNTWYHMDITDSIYVRDGSYQMDGDIFSYFLMTPRVLFELDPDRKIKIIGKNMYDEEITKDNYVLHLGGKKNV